MYPETGQCILGLCSECPRMEYPVTYTLLCNVSADSLSAHTGRILFVICDVRKVVFLPSTSSLSLLEYGVLAFVVYLFALVWRPRFPYPTDLVVPSPQLSISCWGVRFSLFYLLFLLIPTRYLVSSRYTTYLSISC